MTGTQETVVVGYARLLEEKRLLLQTLQLATRELSDIEMHAGQTGVMSKSNAAAAKIVRKECARVLKQFRDEEASGTTTVAQSAPASERISPPSFA